MLTILAATLLKSYLLQFALECVETRNLPVILVISFLLNYFLGQLTNKNVYYTIWPVLEFLEVHFWVHVITFWMRTLVDFFLKPKSVYSQIRKFVCCRELMIKTNVYYKNYCLYVLVALFPAS